MQGNSLIDSLPVEVFARLQPHFEKVILPINQNVLNSGDLLQYVYFPLDSVFYLFTTMENGTTLETGMIGYEGVVGLSVFFGVTTFFNYATVLSSNKALRINAAVIKEEFDKGGSFQKAILRYAHAFFIQISQTAACNRVHPMESRVCRWLLTMRARVKSNTLAVTQEFIARMLSAQRPYVTIAIGLLQKQGIIHCSRGKIEILNYEALKECACECFPLIQEEFNYLQKAVYV